MADTFGRMWIHPPKILSDRNTRMGGENPLEKPPTETHGEPLEISLIIENYIVLLKIILKIILYTNAKSN